MPIQTITVCPANFCYVNVYNASLNLQIDAVEVNSIPVTHIGGNNFPITTGNNGNFTTNDTGSGKIVTITYSGNIPGQNITFYDSSFFGNCYNTNGSPDTIVIYGQNFTAGGTAAVYAADGACF